MTALRTFAFAAILAIASALLLSRGTVIAQSPGGDVKPPAGSEVATFAGGCFWCVESDFDKVDGVLQTVSGFMGGKLAHPTYKQVSAGNTGHLEVVQVTFDPKKVSYQKLVDYFWHKIDPYDAGGQFCDRGESYTTAIFVYTPEQRKIAEASKAALAKDGPLKEPIATAIRDASTFTPAEEYHQDYYKKNPFRYKWYRTGCGRDARLEQVWGKAASH
ncbi:MAG: peptide-methionine (S)-S-oxide reductase MsrA [Hyphomicrobiaceae bacterium]